MNENPLIYRIFEDHMGHVTVQYKRYSCVDAWRPMPNERPLEIFRLNENSEQIIPPGTPNIVLPSLDQEDLRETKRYECHDNSIIDNDASKPQRKG